MNKKFRRRLFNSKTYSLVLLCMGAALFALVAEGFSQAWKRAKPVPPRPVVAAEEGPEPEQPMRYVPPAEVEYPFY